MFLDVTAALSDDRFDLFASVARPEDVGPVRALTPDGCAVTVQIDGDLGRRMHHAIQNGLAQGHPAVALVGSDCPEITADMVAAAFDALERDADAAICPSGDGGYSLIAASSDVAPAFADIAWSTQNVVEMTMSAADAAGLEVARLMPLDDVDRAEDVARVAGDPMRAHPTASRTRAVATTLAARDRGWHSPLESANSPSLY
jgi:2-phospho-L-lactate guanylyltransferase (CobY/MobA/RfbA family)